jgi:hypothetical protein
MGNGIERWSLNSLRLRRMLWVADEFLRDLRSDYREHSVKNLRRCSIVARGQPSILAAANWSEFIHELGRISSYIFVRLGIFKVFTWSRSGALAARSRSFGVPPRRQTHECQPVKGESARSRPRAGSARRSMPCL